MRNLFSSTLFALALSVGVPADAASQGSGGAAQVATMTVKDFISYHDRLERNLGSKQYDYVNASNRARIAREQEAIRKSLAGHQTLEELDANSRSKVFAAHESVIAIMDDAELDKVTCKREHKMGSRMGKTVCTSERARRDALESGRDAMMRNRNCAGADCNST